MADTQEKHEEATPHKRQEARKRGQVARSSDLVVAAGMLAAAMIMRTWGASAFEYLGSIMQYSFTAMATPIQTTSDVSELMRHTGTTALIVLAPLMLGLVVTGLVVNIGQVGFSFSSEALKPQWSRVSPFQGMKRYWSPNTIVDALKALFKVTLVCTISFMSVWGDQARLATSIGTRIIPETSTISDIAFNVMIRAGLVMLAIGIADFLIQRRRLSVTLRMSVQELKEEMKQQEGDPTLRMRIRKKQRMLASRRAVKHTPKADVIITNPTHFAVAIKYDASKMRAPVVIAKGADEIAAQIRNIAKNHRIPIVENPPLARALYAAVELGREIPTALYQAVAEVLAFVYKLRRRGGVI